MKHLLWLLFFVVFVPQSRAGSPIIWGSEGTAKALQQNGIQLNDGTIFDGDDNYIKNSKAEVDTTDWDTYADAAATTPADCTGGSPNTTFTASSSSPLRGNQSFLITKSSGASRQGEGASFGYTVSGADLAKTLAISFDVEIDDADYDAGDLAVYIYDVDTSTLITPTYTDIAGANYKFQTIYTPVDTTSTSYRLCFHIAESANTAWNAKLDNIKVGPELAAQGVPSHDLQADTYGISANSSAFGTTTNETWFSKRDGNMLTVYGTFRCGTTAANPAKIDLPSGLTLDTTAMSTIDQVHRLGIYTRQKGTASAAGILGDNNAGVMYYDTASTSAVYLSNQTESNGYVARNGNDIFSSNEYATVQFQVPISEWAGSSVNLNTAKAEYAFNTDTSDANDTTNFGYGPQGTQGNYAFTSNRVKRVKFLSTIQPTDKIVLELSEDRIHWAPHPAFMTSSNSIYDNYASNTGVSIRTFSDTDKVDVFWGEHRTGTTDWSAETFYWRVVKYPGVIQSATPYYQKIQTISLDNNYTGGEILVARTGNIVTITGKSAGTHTSASSASSSSGLLPSWARPSASAYNTYITTTSTIYRVEVATDGTITTTYYDSGLSANNATSASFINITYVVED